MRGKRTATPDLCRDEPLDRFERKFEHVHRLDRAHRPETLQRVAADPLVQLAISASSSPEYALATGTSMPPSQTPKV